jgi:predicted enzyme related to lactoylglutathione lyase
MNPVGWFEIPVRDLERARRFYENELGLELAPNKMGEMEVAWFPMSEGPGAAGTLIKSEGYTLSHEGTMVYFSVTDIEGTLEKINANGGRTLNPKTGIGEHGFVAHFEDCEGNRGAMHSWT